MIKRMLIGICACLFVSCSQNQKKSDTPMNAPPPKLLAPTVKKIWIPPAMKDGGLEWEEGHYLYRIERGTTWSR